MASPATDRKVSFNDNNPNYIEHMDMVQKANRSKFQENEEMQIEAQFQLDMALAIKKSKEDQEFRPRFFNDKFQTNEMKQVGYYKMRQQIRNYNKQNCIKNEFFGEYDPKVSSDEDPGVFTSGCTEKHK